MISIVFIYQLFYIGNDKNLRKKGNRMIKKILSISLVVLLLMFFGCEGDKNLSPNKSSINESNSNNDNLIDNKKVDVSKSITNIDKLTNIPEEFYEGDIKLSKLPQNCIIVLNNDYGIAIDMVEVDKNSSGQFPNLETTVYLIDIKQNNKTLLVKYGSHYSASSFCIADDNIYFIETYIDEANENSGEWAIKEFNLKNKTLNSIDSGKFEDFSRYDYSDISFKDKESLFPRYLDQSNNKLVYNRITDNQGKLVFDIVLYDVKDKSTQIVASSDNYIDNYFYNVAIDDTIITYTKYHDINDSMKPERDTTYKYCDVYTYDIKTMKTTQISSNDFIIHLDISGNYISGIRYAPLSECKDYLKSVELVVYDINKKQWKAFVYGKSNLTAPKFYKNYLVFADLASNDNSKIYDYVNNKFISLNKEKALNDFEIVGGESGNILMINSQEPNYLYKAVLE